MRTATLAAVLSVCAVAPVWAQEAPPDNDAARIPPTSTGNAQQTEGGTSAGMDVDPDASDGEGTRRIGLDMATAIAGRRIGTAPGADGRDRYQSRAALDATVEWRLSPSWSSTLNDRVVAQEDAREGDSSETTAANDLREVYLAWSGPASIYVDAGRINLRNGTALGWNPTDYLKAGSSIAISSADPSAARVNRLGTAMLQAQKLWSHASFGFALVPKLRDQASLLQQTGSGIDPRFDRTNPEDRYLATMGFDASDLNLQLLLFGKRGSHRLGSNLSKSIGASVIAYAEWSGAWEKGLAARANDFGRSAGDLPAVLPPLPIGDTERHFRNDAAVGASWVIVRRLTLNLEYHYHGSGLSGRELRDAFATSAASPQTLGAEFWFLRAFAADQQEPVAREQIFARMAVDDFFVKDLSVSAFLFRNAHDGSAFAQLSTTYDLSDAYSIRLFVGRTFGGPLTEYGSLPTSNTVALQLFRYL